MARLWSEQVAAQNCTALGLTWLGQWKWRKNWDMDTRLKSGGSCALVEIHRQPRNSGHSLFTTEQGGEFIAHHCMGGRLPNFSEGIRRRVVPVCSHLGGRCHQCILHTLTTFVSDHWKVLPFPLELAWRKPWHSQGSEALGSLTGAWSHQPYGNNTYSLRTSSLFHRKCGV